MTLRVVVIEGDGIGREVIPAAVGVLSELRLGLEFAALDVNAERFLATGEAFPGDAFGQLHAADAILLGAVGDPRVTDPGYTAQTLKRIRSELDLYANVRPARLLDSRLSPLRDPGPVDITVVRENTEGLYSSMGGRLRPGTTAEVAVQEHISTYHGVARVIGYAFSAARSAVVMADKPNAMPHAGALWHRCWREAQAAHPGVPARHLAIDACALHMIADPSQFDVIVTPETGRAMFEPVHGSAPDIAGTGAANPAAAILSGALLLRHLGFTAEAGAVEAAVAGAIRAGECTADAGGSLSTRAAAAAIASRLG
jgi:3-isopropylmalate dehydrogenase